jgi:hypothetical protein
MEIGCWLMPIDCRPGLPSINIGNYSCLWVPKFLFMPRRSLGFLLWSTMWWPPWWVTDFNFVSISPVLGVCCVLTCGRHLV